MKSTFLPALLLSMAMFVGSAKADLLVYEGFDYALDPSVDFTHVDDTVANRFDGLAKNGGTGWGGAWEDMTTGSNNGIPAVFGPQGNTQGTNPRNPNDPVSEENPAKPDWDGVVDSIEQTGGYVSLSPDSSDQFEDRLNMRRQLGQSAGALAGTDNVLWASMVVHFEDSRFNFAPGLMLTDGGGFSERVRDITDFSTGIGIGHGSAWGIDLNAITYNAGAFDTRTNVSNLSTANPDNVIVLKFEFGPTSDTISTWFFPEDQTPSESDFNTNALSTTSSFNIDENSLTTLAVGFTRAGNAYDEIRLGDTFADVTPTSGGPTVLAGDFNGDDVVDLADYTLWRNNVGEPAGTLPNDESGEVIGTTQYNDWRANFGATASLGGVTTVPEPGSIALLSLAGLALIGLYRRR